MSIHLRSARPGERGPLEELQRRASLSWTEHRDYILANPEVIELSLAHLRQGRVRVAEWNGRAAGFATLLPKADAYELDGLFVEPDLWRLGLGRALVADALAIARAGGAVALETAANPHAERFYKRLGFTITGPVQTPFGLANRMKIPVISAQT